MMRRSTVILVLLLAVVCVVGAKEVPFLGGRVNDLADMMPADAEQRVEEVLTRLETDTGAQVAVLTVPSLEGEVLESYALKVAETWQLGREEQDDGILILVAKAERKIRIEVGYGLEGVVPDVTAKRIIEDFMRPRFQDGAFADGIEDAAGALAGYIRGEEVVPPETVGQGLNGAPTILAMLFGGSIFFLVIGTFSAVALFAKGGEGWFVYVFLIPFYLLFPIGIFGLWGLVLPVLWIVGFPILRTMTWKTDWGRSFRKSHPGWTSFAASSGRSSGGGFSSFSGGGGSFGGGGASGGW